MTNFITLTDEGTQDAVLINLDQVEQISPRGQEGPLDGQTRIRFVCGRAMTALEDFTEVKRRIEHVLTAAQAMTIDGLDELRHAIFELSRHVRHV